MIGLIEIRERAREWSLRDDIVEKDYILGWLLWGIASHSALGQAWVFKGGTCLKKCYFETYRFSEDLDFTVIKGGTLDPAQLTRFFVEIADRIYERSGIEIPRELIRFEAYTTKRGSTSVEGRIAYRGPRRPGGDLPRVKLDLTADEVLVQEAVLREISHPYGDQPPEPPKIACYSMPELLGEKLRALAERCLPRDLYDIISIYRRPDLRPAPEVVREILSHKCRHKEVAIPTYASIEASPRRAELESEWGNMLAHQLPALPPLDGFLAELSDLFLWLDGRKEEAPALPVFPLAADVESAWAPPLRLSVWGLAVPLETIRFAAANRLCVDLGYQGTVRRVEPYSLRRTRDGHLLVYAVRRDNMEVRAYRVNRIESVQVTGERFTPVYPVEFWPAGEISAAPVRSPLVYGPRRTPPSRSGPRYVVECTYCGKNFTRRDTRIARHKMKGDPDTDCPGRTGFIVRMAD